MREERKEGKAKSPLCLSEQGAMRTACDNGQKRHCVLKLYRIQKKAFSVTFLPALPICKEPPLSRD